MTDKSIEEQNIDLILKRKEMTKDSWIRNVIRIYPDKTYQETELLWQKVFESETPKP
jgi:hypothetical protein